MVSDGTGSASVTQKVHLTDASLTTHVMQNLPAGTWYFGIASVSSARVESALSNTLGGTVP